MLVSNPGQFAQGAKLGAQYRTEQVKAIPQKVQQVQNAGNKFLTQTPVGRNVVYPFITAASAVPFGVASFVSKKPAQFYKANLEESNRLASPVAKVPKFVPLVGGTPYANLAGSIAGDPGTAFGFGTGSLARKVGSAAAVSGLSGFLQPAESSRERTQNTLVSGALGGVVPLTGPAVNKLSQVVLRKFPKSTPAQVQNLTNTFIRDELGRFSDKPGFKKPQTKWVGDMRAELGLPRHGNYTKETFLQALKNEEGFIRIPSFGQKSSGKVSKEAITGATQRQPILQPNLEGQTPSQLGPYASSISQPENQFVRSLGEPTLPGSKQRGFITNVKTSPNSTKELAAGVSGTYNPVSNKQSLDDARNLIKTNYTQARDLVFDTSKAPDSLSTATALELADQAQKSGRIDEAIDIVNNYAERLTQSGQASQAASIWSRLSPVTVLRKANQDYKKATGKVLPPEIGTRVTQLAKEVESLPEGAEKLLKTTQLYKELADNVPSALGSKLTNLWKATLLTATKTHIVNLVSTGAFQTLENVSKGLGTLVDIAASVATKKRTVNLSPRNLVEQAKGLKEGLGNAKTVFKTGVNPAEVATLDTVRQVNYGKSLVGKALNAYTQTVFRSLGAADALLKAPALKSSLLEQAELAVKNQGLKGKTYQAAVDTLFNHPTPEMAKKAYEAAQFATFNNPNAISKAVSGAKVIGGKPAEVAIDLTIPFVRTPSNIAGRLIDYSPVGLLANVAKGIADKDQRAIVMGISRGATGSTIIAAGAVLAANGLLTGKYPSDRTEQARWEAEGKKANSILINGSWRQLSAVSPLGNLLGVGADIHNLAEAGKTGSDLVATTAFSAVNSLSNQTFLKGLSGTVNAALNPEQYGGSYLNSFAGSLVPAVVGAAARGVDPNQREISSPTDAIASRIPGLSKTLPARIDVTGKEVKRDGGLVGQFLDPFGSSKNKPNPVLDEIKRLREVDSSLTLSRPGDSVKGFDVGKEGINRINQLAGGVIDTSLQKAISSPGWANLDDTSKIRVIKLVTDRARDFARTSVWSDTVAKQLNQGLSTEEKAKIVISFKKLSPAEKEYFVKKVQESRQGTQIVQAP